MTFFCLQRKKKNVKKNMYKIKEKYELLAKMKCKFLLFN